ncbi:MAG: SPOR domain-containing protein [Bacteroidales bacterium]|nr:SPOR domain-containing protein [Bacteroidales bacterium]
MKFRIFIWLVLISFPLLLSGQKKKPEPMIPATYCLSANELQLYRLINVYRQEHGLGIIPLSRSLSYVAYVHLRDLQNNRPDFSGCNLHSWSNKGTWTPCCYAKDPKRQECMKNKPGELTGYKGDAQEIIMWENKSSTPQGALDQWSSLEPTNDLLVKQRRWADKNWQAMGVALYEGYASVWFGETADKVLAIKLCDDGRQISHRFMIDELLQSRQIAQAPDSQDTSPKSQDTSPKPQEKSPKPQDTSPKPQDASPKSQNTSPKPQDPSPKPQDTSPKPQDTSPKPEPQPLKLNEAEAQPQSQSQSSNRYYLIVSSFKTAQQAGQEVKRLIANGYTDARMIVKDGNFRVSIFDYNNESDAKKEQQALSNVFKGIWVMEK